MSWVSFTADHIKARLAKGEFDNFASVGNQSADGVDITASIIEQVVAMVRGKVAAWRDNIPLMGPTGTIPSEAIFAASTIAREALVGSLPLSESSTDVRRDELRRAHDYLDQIARGEIRLEDSYTANTSTGSAQFGGSALMNF
jgi:hypothetical protein